MKKVSVIIPVYNVYEYLEECLESVANQTIVLNSIEVIIINDGSKDKSMEIINKYGKKYPDWIIINRENKGLSITRNEGIDIASSEYLMFLDSDDYLDENALEEMYDLAKKENSDVLVGRMRAFDSKGFYGYYSDKYIKSNETFSLKENKKILKAISVCCKLYKTDFVKKIHFIPNIHHEDNYFSMTVYSKAKRITTIPNAYYYRRYREGENLSIMQNLTINDFYDLVKNYEFYFKEYCFNKIIMKFSIKSFNNYIISRLPKNDKKNARKKVKDYLKYLFDISCLNREKYCLYYIYQEVYYFLASIYYRLSLIIK